MLKNLTLCIVLAIAASSCGLVDGSGTSSEAQVDILNQDQSLGRDEGDGESDLASSVDTENDTDTTDDAEPEADGTDGETATASSGGAGTVFEVLDGAVVIVDGDGRVSADASNLQEAWGYLMIDDVYATDRFDQQSPSSGNKFVAIDYHFIVAEDDGYLYPDAYRLVTGGETYQPVLALEASTLVGQVHNAAFWFEVPEGAQSFELRAGAPDDAIDGFLTSYSFALKAGEAEVPELLSDEEIELTTTNIVLTSDQDTMSAAPSIPLGAVGQLLVDSARTTAQLDSAAVGPNYKYLIVDYQMIGLEYGNFFGDAFRVEAKGEWYSPINDVADIIDLGDVTNDVLVFIVPRDATEFVFEGGVPVQFEEGNRATYAISFNGASPTVDDVAADDVDVELEASSISLASDDNRMATQPAFKGGTWGTLVIDSARTTAKVDADGAEPGWKFLVVEFRVEGGSYGNLSDSAFRVIADGEKYSTLNDFADILDVGDVFTETAVFLVPRSATSFTLVGGAVESSPEGITTRYNINF